MYIQKKIAVFELPCKDFTFIHTSKRERDMNKFILTALIIACCSETTLAAEKVKGTFKVDQACEAYSSFKKKKNPGQIHIKPGKIYNAVEINTEKEWDWIRVAMGKKNDDLRWVSKECGTAKITVAQSSTSTGNNGSITCSTPNQYDSYVLTMTWQPGFCEHFAYQGSKPECDAMMKQNNEKLVISHLTLHGLWPNKSECGTKYGHCADTALDLKKSTVEEIDDWMPNFFFSTAFGSYEWKKHGTCQERDDDAYFLLAKDLLQRVDHSAIGTYLRDNIGETINADAYRKHIEKKLGKEVADRVQLVCSKKKYLQEIRLNLPKNIVVDNDLAKMVSEAKTFRSFTSRCAKDIYIERSGKH
ncbi:ribonuclease T2 [Candidatus Electrothrix aarhusensis]|uniref:Ribonuclease T2 n=1 Tax=Candidatus Electrothrix aarhusensis TaxID=1859131 RepID=A0A444IQ99_9BACT|nr:ribonuclease T2 [Candidatus Electrothrix aarhusensis]